MRSRYPPSKIQLLVTTVVTGVVTLVAVSYMFGNGFSTFGLIWVGMAGYIGVQAAKNLKKRVVDESTLEGRPGPEGLDRSRSGEPDWSGPDRAPSPHLRSTDQTRWGDAPSTDQTRWGGARSTDRPGWGGTESADQVRWREAEAADQARWDAAQAADQARWRDAESTDRPRNSPIEEVGGARITSPIEEVGWAARLRRLRQSGENALSRPQRQPASPGERPAPAYDQRPARRTPGRTGAIVSAVVSSVVWLVVIAVVLNFFPRMGFPGSEGDGSSFLYLWAGAGALIIVVNLVRAFTRR
ncbi:hypothetical protein ABT336_09805 [Micromonospora sp. NPDC000207]|uniref:hypothetical protein n=1 Tax=Micromonospora sp. NPDC000207 TaxID=3154246 RepID=UPI00331936E9